MKTGEVKKLSKCQFVFFLVTQFHSCHEGKISNLGDATSAFFFFQQQNNLISNFWQMGLSPLSEGLSQNS